MNMPDLKLIFALVYLAVVLVAVLHVVMDDRQPAKTVAWVLVITFVPVVGILFYIFFGVNTRRERLISQRSLDQLTKRSLSGFVTQHNLQLPETYKPVIDLFVNQNMALPFKDNQFAIHTDGHQFFIALFKAIGCAHNHIHIDMYIFEDDPLGRLLADMLIDKARQGVEVRIVYDDVGCWKVSHRFFERMREEGIEVVPFLPVRFPSFTRKVNYRNHRKIIVIDGHVGFIGGMNIALRYVKGRSRGLQIPSTAAGEDWRDTMLQVSGPVVYALQRTFLIDWYFVDRTQLSDRKYYPETDERKTKHDEWAGSSSLPATLRTSLAQVVTSSPNTPYPEIMQGFVHIVLAARRYIYIETPYFLPNEPVLFALKTAAVAGIDVRLLVPLHGDARFTEWASRSYLREARDAGISVGFYTGGFLHSKLMVVDDAISTCGSTNIDFRSFENNFEANIFIYDEPMAKSMKETFLTDEQQSVALTNLPRRSHPPFLMRLGESLCRLLAPLM